MSAIMVEQTQSLYGDVLIQGSKNATLPIMAACLLIDGVCTLTNVPQILDVDCMCHLLKLCGCKVERWEHTLTIDATGVHCCPFPPDEVLRMRSSITLLGPLLSRCGKVEMSYPGGCVIGERPINYHKLLLEQMGVCFWNTKEGFGASCDGLQGTYLRLPFPSVGATENAILAAVLAKGTTWIYGYAKEPEIKILCAFLRQAGAKISDFGDMVLQIEGVKRLRPITWEIPADRIVAGTYMCGLAAVGGKVRLQKAPEKELRALLIHLQAMGVTISKDSLGLVLERSGRLCGIPFLETGIYPGFPTDLQSAMLVVLTQCWGNCVVKEGIFNNRFHIIKYLNALGACIKQEGNMAYVHGPTDFLAGTMGAEELRGGAALVLAALLAKGQSRIENISYIKRGYEDIVFDLQSLGGRLWYES